MFEVVLTLAFLHFEIPAWFGVPLKQTWHQYEEPLKRRYNSMEACMKELQAAESEVVPRLREESGEAVTVRGSRCQQSTLREI